MQVNIPHSITTLSPSLVAGNMNMNKFNFVRDGESKLPPGFRFQPTDEEIVFQYLAPKIFSHPLPASVIPEINMISSFDPWELPGNMEQDRYFFANNRSSSMNRMMRGSDGFWKCTSLDKQITCSKRRPIVGVKKTLVFYKGKHLTNWCMHLFCIAIPRNAPSNIHHKGSLIQIGKWVMCHVFSKRSVIKQQINYDRFKRKELSDTDSSSSSSSDSNSSDFSEVSSGSVTS